MTKPMKVGTTKLNLEDPRARTSLAQVYRLLLRTAHEAEVPAESAETETGTDGDQLQVDRHSYDTSSSDQEQAQCPA